MKSIRRLLFLGLLAALVVGLVVPAAAQEGPGQGGIIIEGNFGSDPSTFNPIICTDTICRRINQLTLPAFIGVDPETATLAPVGENPRVRGALVTGWEVSEDGLVYTFTLRDDWTWNDGTPITSADYLYAWNAIMSGTVDTNLGYIADAIATVEAPDPLTVVVTLHQPDCNGLLYASFIPPMPAHILPADFAELNDAEWNMNPTVTAGAFSFGQFRPGELTSVIADQNFPDAELGYVSPEGFILKQVPDNTVLVEQFLAGETNVIDNPAVERRSDIRAQGDSGEAQVFTYPGDRWDYMAFNLADPANPQNALDENGNPIDQGHHPLFGDARVRRAIALAIDVDAIIDGAVFGEGTRMPSVITPGSWAFDHDLAPIPYDPDAARALLAEAGWTDEDGNGVLEAHGAPYAEDGTEFRFVLYTNEGNTRRAAIGTIIQDQLAQLGIVVDFQAIDFNTLLDIQDNQAFDAVILGWRAGYPDDPDVTQLFSAESDVVGSGDNFTSYNNPEVLDLLRQARTVPGCATVDRAAIYADVQRIMQEDLPYLWLFAIDGMYAARANVENFSPYTAQLYWNVDSWRVTP